MEFSVLDSESQNQHFYSTLSGIHNLQNITACIGIARHLDITWDQIGKALITFKGVKRRQEIIGNVDNILIMLDFAHHPTAIRETLFGLKSRYSKRRIIAVFEPRTQTSRRNIFQDQFPDAFCYADIIILAPVYNPYHLPDTELLSTDLVLEELETKNKTGYNPDSYADIITRLLDTARDGDLVVFMSSGDFEGVPTEFIHKLREKHNGNCCERS